MPTIDIPESEVKDYIKWRLSSLEVFSAQVEVFELFERFYTRNDKLPAPSEIERKFILTVSDYGERKINCIKMVRRFTSMGLREAKAFVEGYSTFTSPQYTRLATGELVTTKKFTKLEADAFVWAIEDQGGKAIAIDTEASPDPDFSTHW